MQTALRSLREKSGESMLAFSLRVGVEPGLLSLIERGKRPNRKTADRIATALHVDPRSLWDQYDHFRKW